MSRERVWSPVRIITREELERIYPLKICEHEIQMLVVDEGPFPEGYDGRRPVCVKCGYVAPNATSVEEKNDG